MIVQLQTPAAMQLNSTPRVNFDLMQRYIGKKVKLVCQLEKVDANRAVVKTADGGTVYVTMKQAPTFETQFVEFDGIVESPTTLTETDRTPFGNSFDMNNYNELCRISVIDFPEVFV